MRKKISMLGSSFWDLLVEEERTTSNLYWGGVKKRKIIEIDQKQKWKMKKGFAVVQEWWKAKTPSNASYRGIKKRRKWFMILMKIKS